MAIDAPLIVPNVAGRRYCESVIHRWLGSRDAGAHSANASMAAFAGVPRGARLAQALDLSLDPVLASGSSLRRAIEVYPHPALVVLFDLPKTLKYKAARGRTVHSRREEFRRLMRLLEGLSQAVPSMSVASARWSTLRSVIDETNSHSELDRAEDEIDAYVCAYIALHHWTHGGSATRVIGSFSDGYIVCPITRASGAESPDLRDSLAQALEKTAAARFLESTSQEKQ